MLARTGDVVRPITERSRVRMTSISTLDTDLSNDLSTGVIGLDEILMGGLTPRRLYLLEGAPGSGKHDTAFVGAATPSGVTDLDSLLNGGPPRGTTTLISGPAGAGKTTLALQYVAAACARGERAAIYEFDERIGTLLLR
jgi:KaiC/GvpD/RAD55 family RecA-like ATPase